MFCLHHLSRQPLGHAGGQMGASRSVLDREHLALRVRPGDEISTLVRDNHVNIA